MTAITANPAAANPAAADTLALAGRVLIAAIFVLTDLLVSGLDRPAWGIAPPAAACAGSWPARRGFPPAP